MMDPGASAGGMSLPLSAESILSNPPQVKSHQVEWNLKVLDLLHVSVGCSLHHFLAS